MNLECYFEQMFQQDLYTQTVPFPSKKYERSISFVILYIQATIKQEQDRH